MSKEVLISIQSMQNLNGFDSEGPELITLGDYEFATDGIRFSYMESELTGLDGTKTVFQILPSEEVTLTRSGTVNARMVFRRGEKHSFRYHTGVGVLQLDVDTKRLYLDMDEHGGDMEIEYDLNFERSYLSRNRFVIKVREKELKS